MTRQFLRLVSGKMRNKGKGRWSMDGKNQQHFHDFFRTILIIFLDDVIFTVVLPDTREIESLICKNVSI